MSLTRRRFVSLATVSAGAAAFLRGDLLGAEARQAAAAAAALDSWDGVRRLFDLDPQWVHASLFYLASHPRPVREVVDRWRRALDANPHDVVEHGWFDPSPNDTDHVLAALARYVGGSPADIALTNNTTGGLALVHHGLPLRAGDEVLTTAHDHVVHHEAIRFATERAGATWRRVPLFPPHDASGTTAASIVAALRQAIGPKTRVLAVTWVHSSSGVKLPISAIAAAVREVNAARAADDRVLLVVDGVHGLGTDETEVAKSGADVFVAGLHKWMLAPRGTGFVWARPEVWARMRPITPTFASPALYEAWQEERAPQGPPQASWFSLGGFQSFEHLWGVATAVALHEEIGRARIAARIHALNDSARRQLAAMSHVRLRTPLDPALSAGITAFEVDGIAPADVVARLRAQRIIATTSPYKVTYPRLSFGIANSEADVQKAVAAVAALTPS